MTSLALKGEIGPVYYKLCTLNVYIVKKIIWTVAATLPNEEATPVRSVEPKLNTVIECFRSPRRYARVGASDAQSRRCLAGSSCLGSLVLPAATVAFGIVV